MKTVTYTFHHKTLKSDAENFHGIKRDYDDRQVAYENVEGGIKRQSDNVDFEVLTLADLIDHPQGEMIFAGLLQKIVLSDTDVRKAVVNGTEIPTIDADYLKASLESKKGSGAVRFTADERKAMAAELLELYFGQVPEKVQNVIKTLFESGASKAKITAINNMDFVTKVMEKLIELAEVEEDTKLATFETQLAESIADYIEAKEAEAEELEGFEF